MTTRESLRIPSSSDAKSLDISVKGEVAASKQRLKPLEMTSETNKDQTPVVPLQRSMSPRVLKHGNHSNQRRPESYKSLCSSEGLHERELLERFRHVYAGRGGHLHGSHVSLSSAGSPWVSLERRYKQEILGKLAKNFSKKRLRATQMKLSSTTVDSELRTTTSRHSQISLQQQDSPRTREKTPPTLHLDQDINREIVLPTSASRVKDLHATYKTPQTLYRSNYVGPPTKETQLQKYNGSNLQSGSALDKHATRDVASGSHGKSLCQSAAKDKINDRIDLKNRLGSEEPCSTCNRHNIIGNPQKPLEGNSRSVLQDNEQDVETAKDGVTPRDVDQSTSDDVHNKAAVKMSRDIYPAESEMLQKYKATRGDGDLKPSKSSTEVKKTYPIMSQLSVEARKALSETREEMCADLPEKDDNGVSEMKSDDVDDVDNACEADLDNTGSQKYETIIEEENNETSSTPVNSSVDDKIKQPIEETATITSLQHKQSPKGNNVNPRKPNKERRTDHTPTSSDVKQKPSERGSHKKPKRQTPPKTTTNARPTKAGRLPQITSLDTSRLPRESDLSWNNKSRGLLQQGQYKDIPQQATNFMLTRERTFKITPAGYDSRFNDVPVALIEDDIPAEVKVKAISKCSEWMDKYM